MCLQYALWAFTAIGHPKYDQYAEAFYKRARQYIEADEMRVSRPFSVLILTTFCVLTHRLRAMASIS